MVTVLRAYCRYLLQTGLPFSQGYIAQVLANNAGHRALPRRSVRGALRPAISPAARAAPRSPGSISTSARRLEEVTRSDEDRILRALWNALSVTVRTNAYQTDGGRPAQGLPVLQDRKPEVARIAAAEADVRDIRVLDAHGGRAPAHGAAWRAAASAGRTGARTSAPKYSG